MSDSQKKDFWCVVALDEGGTAWIVQRSEDTRLCDLLPECTGEDNGFDSNWDKGLDAGLYRLVLKPLSYKTYEGDWDCGIDVVKVDPLHVLTGAMGNITLPNTEDVKC